MTKKGKLYRFAKSVWMWLCAFGINPLAVCYAFRFLCITSRELRQLKRQNKIAGHPFRISFSLPCFGDRLDKSGATKEHYFSQDLYAARKIFERNPARHVDVGSRVDGFVAHVASFRTIEVLDIRPLPVNIPAIQFKQANLMELHEELHGCYDSLSCLHALEHFGLGRYGDPIDLWGHVKGFESLSRIVKTGGMFYLSVPIGPERIEFNGHRVFNIQTILGLAEPLFTLEAFSYVDDNEDFHENVTLRSDVITGNCGCRFGCGIFEFRKK